MRSSYEMGSMPAYRHSSFPSGESTFPSSGFPQRVDEPRRLIPDRRRETPVSQLNRSPPRNGSPPRNRAPARRQMNTHTDHHHGHNHNHDHRPLPKVETKTTPTPTMKPTNTNTPPNKYVKPISVDVVPKATKDIQVVIKRVPDRVVPKPPTAGKLGINPLLAEKVANTKTDEKVAYELKPDKSTKSNQVVVKPVPDRVVPDPPTTGTFGINPLPAEKVANTKTDEKVAYELKPDKSTKSNQVVVKPVPDRVVPDPPTTGTLGINPLPAVDVTHPTIEEKVAAEIEVALKKIDAENVAADFALNSVASKQTEPGNVATGAAEKLQDISVKTVMNIGGSKPPGGMPILLSGTQKVKARGPCELPPNCMCTCGKLVCERTLKRMTFSCSEGCQISCEY
ncbi:uncharacterized protein LOC128203178 [Mya arenaria]|uniref:uncharacterized protein LOC128203178 n=1 Tax=Mya arenaria TaxID=6604 RepID=UPI0022E88A37|nr:uncharacterized protein LOC128203178 [Mya arenaria]